MGQGRRYSLLEVLGRHDSGDFVGDAEKQLAKIIKDVTRYGQKGSMTIKINVKPQEQGRSIALTPEVAITLPKRVSGDSFYFPDEDGDLFRNPPPDEGDELLREVADNKDHRPKAKGETA